MERNKFPVSILDKHVDYDIQNEPLVLSKESFITLSQQSQFENLLILYCFYYSTSKWKYIDINLSNNFHVADRLNWTVNKVKKVKKLLVELGLVEDIVKRDKNDNIISHVLQINFTTKNNVLKSTCNHKDIKNDFINKIPKKKNNNIKNTIPPTLEMVEKYCNERHNNIDAQNFVDFYTSKGWKIGKEKMKDWQASVRTWERNRKVKEKQPIFDDGIKYIWSIKKQMYVHSVTGEIYIP